jgi:hypothetical protein
VRSLLFGACFFRIMPENLDPFRAEFAVPGEFHPIGAVTGGYRADDLPPQSPGSRNSAAMLQMSCIAGNGAPSGLAHNDLPELDQGLDAVTGLGEVR